jgi:glycosyltransferase involved in cell wall biosynthesis
MRVAYITTENLKYDMGVRKKIYGQINAMQKSGLDTVLIGTLDEEIVVKEGETFQTLGEYNKETPFRFFSLTKNLYEYAYKSIEKNEIEAVYIRYSMSEPSLIRFLKKLKALSINIFIEIPSFPYDSEYDNKQFYKRIGLYIDKFYRRKLKKYVDIIFTPTPNQNNIFGVKTKYFDNAISTELMGKRDYDGPKEEKLRLLGVANLNAWHGYDRVIRGIAKYYKENNDIDVTFNVVGDGVELENLKKLTKDLNIEDRVIFHGRQYGGDLDKIYENSDVAVSSIAFFRLDSIPHTSLKAREACMKSIPFIAVKGEPIFDKDFDYVYFVEDVDKPIEMEKVYNWFSNLDPEVYIDLMYEFGRRSLSWEKNFKSVTLSMKDIIKNDNSGNSN